MTYQTTFLNHELRLTAHFVGKELSVLCTGGSQPHIGGCAMAVPYTNANKPSAAVSALAAPGHRDADLAADMAKRICRRTGRTVFVQCGIHYDNLTPEELQELCGNVLALCDEIEDEP